MGSREFEPEQGTCENCGLKNVAVYDIYGDIFCANCMAGGANPEPEDETVVCHHRHDDLKVLENGLVLWVLERWDAEVSNCPAQNVHRQTLDDTWRQIYRRLTGEEMPRPPISSLNTLIKKK